MTDDPVVLRFRKVGSRALLVEVDDLAAVSAVRSWVVSNLAEGLQVPRDVVPAARSVLLDGIDPTAWREVLARQEIRRGEAPMGEDVVVPVRYDGADLAAVADLWGCSVDEVVVRHQTTDFVVAFCGFAPGFAYCSPRDTWPTVPRRSEPRERVPAGSVGLAGEFCGLYPNAMPGGWMLIGRTQERLFDPERAKAALLQPGDRVRFEAVR